MGDKNKMQISFKDKRVVVTGGSKGIGRSIALAFAEGGAAVSICARGKAALEATAAEITKHGVKAHAGECDLADKSAITLLRVEGHVVGKDAQARSELRAMAVAKALVKAGVDCHRLLAVGFGASKPAFEDAAQNTRMVFANAQLRGHAIGGAPVDGGGKVAGDVCAP